MPRVKGSVWMSRERKTHEASWARAEYGTEEAAEPLKPRSRWLSEYAAEEGDAAGEGDAEAGDNASASASASAEEARKRRSRWLGSAAAAPLVLGIIGFIPAYVVALQGKGWWYNAFTLGEAPWVIAAQRRLGVVWAAAETFHALTGPVWVAVALHQVYTGATGVPGDERKVRHRRFGYVAAGVGLLLSFEAFVLKLLTLELVASLPIYVNALMIAGNLLWGLRCAREADYATHKLAMMLACFWSGAPSGIRLATYSAYFLFHCNLFGASAVDLLGAIALVGTLPVVAVCCIGDGKTPTFLVNAAVVLLLLVGEVVYQTAYSLPTCGLIV